MHADDLLSVWKHLGRGGLEDIPPTRPGVGGVRRCGVGYRGDPCHAEFPHPGQAHGALLAGQQCVAFVSDRTVYYVQITRTSLSSCVALLAHAVVRFKPAVFVAMSWPHWGYAGHRVPTPRPCAQKLTFAKTKSDAVAKIEGTYVPKDKTERQKQNKAARGVPLPRCADVSVAVQVWWWSSLISGWGCPGGPCLWSQLACSPTPLQGNWGFLQLRQAT